MLPLICGKLKQNGQEDQALVFKSVHLEKSTSWVLSGTKGCRSGRSAVMFLFQTKCVRYVCFVTTC